MVDAEGLVGLILFGAWIFAIFDVITATDAQHLPKQAWIMLVIFLGPIGGILWLVVGRDKRSSGQVSAGPAYTTGVPSGLPPRHQRSGPVAPDDDPLFADYTEESRRKQARLDAWEADLARREREIRPEADPA